MIITDAGNNRQIIFCVHWKPTKKRRHQPWCLEFAKTWSMIFKRVFFRVHVARIVLDHSQQGEQHQESDWRRVQSCQFLINFNPLLFPPEGFHHFVFSGQWNHLSVSWHVPSSLPLICSQQLMGPPPFHWEKTKISRDFGTISRIFLIISKVPGGRDAIFFGQ